MKRVIAGLLLSGLAFGITIYILKTRQSDFSPVGSWTIPTKFKQASNDKSYFVRFNADSTCSILDGYLTGTWKSEGDDIWLKLGNQHANNGGLWNSMWKMQAYPMIINRSKDSLTWTQKSTGKSLTFVRLEKETLR